MNTSTNPYSFFPADVNSSTIVASPSGLVLQPNGTVILTTVPNHNLVAGNYVTVTAPTNPAYQGYYVVQSITSPIIAVIMPFAFTPPNNTPASGGGNVAINQYSHDIRVQNISWQEVSAIGQNLIIVDRNGNPVWETTAPGPGTLNTGILYTVSGISIIEMDAGVVLVTVRLP